MAETCAYYHCNGEPYDAGVCEQHSEAEERIRELESVDPRWRPMESAPKDGTRIEILKQDGKMDIGAWRPKGISDDDQRARWEGWYGHNGYLEISVVAWRPAHPEWLDMAKGDG